MVLSPDPLSVDLIKTQFGETYEQFSRADQENHLELLSSITRPADVAIRIEERSHGNWTVTICTSDHLGILAVIAGIFTSCNMDIVRADLFTLEVPRSPQPHRRPGHRPRPLAQNVSAPRRRILDIFEVDVPMEETPNLWERFRADLEELVGLLVIGKADEVRDRVIDRVSAILPTSTYSRANLVPMSIDVVNDETSPFTRLEIISPDTPGFLFAFTNALSGSTINIERALIRTEEGEAHDTFWVTDQLGQRVTKPERIQELRVVSALLKQFTYLLPRSPNPGQALRQFRGLVSQMLTSQQWASHLSNLGSPEVLETLAELMGVSRFLWEDFLRVQHDNLYPVLVDVPALDAAPSKDQLSAALQERFHSRSLLNGRVEELNAFKDREMFRIDLRHITGRVPFVSFSEELADLAEVIVETAADLAHQMVQEERNIAPASVQGLPWSISGMGKFGGRELGFGSDIELLFVFEKELYSGTTSAPYFEDFVRKTISIIRARQNGVFEIDLRLRPHGRSGALAVSLDAFKSYYSVDREAQQFERMAIVKVQPVPGDPDLGERIMSLRDAFVYSGQPLDFDNILHLRNRQATELVHLGQVNAKYSHGGLVDIEYCVQAHQITSGHSDVRVRVTNTLDAIDRLEGAGHITETRAQTLRETYSFLRRLIDALRVVRGNAKDLNIPPTDSTEFTYLTRRLQYDSNKDLENAISAQMKAARSVWEHQ